MPRLICGVLVIPCDASDLMGQLPRGIYCLLAVATILDLITPELIKGLRAFIARYVRLFVMTGDNHESASISCQTYEGGFSAASQPYFSASPPSLDTILESPRPALGEAHGGYTFCALASLVLLEPLDPHPNPLKWMGINVRRLYRWAASMQGLPIDGGGFKGRTNKLVDGCYSWWVGGLFPLLEDIIGVSSSAIPHSPDKTENRSDDDGE